MPLTRARRFAASIATNGRIELIQEQVQAALTRELPYDFAQEALDNLLRHAVATVPHYSGISPDDLRNFPVCSKADMKASPSKFLSSSYRPSTLTTVATSGSTGVPFTSYRDAGKRVRHQGSLVGTFKFQNADPFGPRIVTKAWGSAGFRPRLVSRVKQEVQHSAGSVMHPKTRQVSKWIRKHPGALVMGYSSYLEQIIREVEENDVDLPLPVGALIGASEPASDYLINRAQKVFGTPLKMRYSNMENGMVAVTNTDINRYHVDYSSFNVEVLEEESDTPAAPGTTGRLVITDLYNYGMPFIRYDTGDLAAWATDESGAVEAQTLCDIAGRRLDTISLSKEDPRDVAHALQIWAPTAQLVDIRQFQLRQHDIGVFTWILNAAKSDELEQQLTKILRERVGPLSHLTFKYVQDVPVLASGKRQFFVNEMTNIDQ